MATRQRKQVNWYDTQNGALWVGLVSLVLAYIFASRAINTGSWWEYFGTLLFLIVGFNRLITAVRRGKPTNK
jgi:hypothetical protein